MLDGVPILNQNIAQQNNGIVVAGDNGTGSAQNQFANPAAIFVDKDGNLFIPDMTIIAYRNGLLELPVELL